MPHDLSYDEKTAVIVVDVQNDFADPEGSLYVPDGEKTIRFVNEQVARAQGAGALVVYTQDWHPESTPHFQKDGGVWPVHCVMGTWGAEFHPGLEVVGPVVRKGSNGEDGYSGFTMRDPISGEDRPTALESMLRDHAVTRVVVTGLATDYCVRGTVLDACRLGLETTVLTDAVAAVELHEGDGAHALSEMAEAGAQLE